MCTCDCSFKKYALTSRGIGLKIVTLVSLLIGVVVGFSGPVIIREALDENGSLNEFINTLPVITIENGKIVNPIYENDTWVIPGLKEGNKDFKIIANTAVDSVPSMPADADLYITARNIYTPEAVTQIPAELSTVINHDTVRRYVNLTLRMSGAVLGGIIFLLGIIGFLIIYLPVMVIGRIMNSDLQIDTWGRILAWPWSIFYAIVILLSTFTTIAISPLYGALIPMLITWILGVLLNKGDDEHCCLTANEKSTDGISETTDTETTVEFEEIPQSTPTPATVSASPIVRKKTVNIKPKNVPTTKKGKSKKKK